MHGMQTMPHARRCAWHQPADFRSLMALARHACSAAPKPKHAHAQRAAAAAAAEPSRHSKRLRGERAEGDGMQGAEGKREEGEEVDPELSQFVVDGRCPRYACVELACTMLSSKQHRIPVWFSTCLHPSPVRAACESGAPSLHASQACTWGCVAA